MPEMNPRIEQFKKMADADPDNELGHFSLGRAYFDAGFLPEAIASYRKVIELNPKLSKVYQLLAVALLKDGKTDEAIAQLTAGVKIADERGDLMPKNEMIKMLRDMGAPVPEVKSAAAADRPLTEGEVLCARCGQVKPKMAHPPFSHEQGRIIQQNICADCWREWIGMGTKVINELRLPLNDPRAQKEYDRHMFEFLNLPQQAK
jgi:Fe-S cluster biosynthesis and repair protein YggX